MIRARGGEGRGGRSPSECADSTVDQWSLLLPVAGVRRDPKLADLESSIGLRNQRISTRGDLAVFRGGCRPGGRTRQGQIAANRHLAKHAIGDRLGEPIGAVGRVMGPVGPEHPLRASLLNRPVQVVDGHA